MNCIDCDAHMEDLQAGEHYCRELKVLISPGDAKCPRQQAESSFTEHIINRFSKVK